MDTLPTVEISKASEVYESESKIETQTENTCVSILSKDLSKVESNVVSHMDEPEVKINSDNILDTVPTIEISKAIKSDEPESKIETQTQNNCESILSNDISKVESDLVSHMDEPEVEINSDNEIEKLTVEYFIQTCNISQQDEYIDIEEHKQEHFIGTTNIPEQVDITENCNIEKIRPTNEANMNSGINT